MTELIKTAVMTALMVAAVKFVLVRLGGPFAAFAGQYL